MRLTHSNHIVLDLDEFNKETAKQAKEMKPDETKEPEVPIFLIKDEAWKAHDKLKEMLPTALEDAQQWDLHEIFSGTAIVTKTAEGRGLLAGPPIDLNTGWNLKRPEDQAALRLLWRVHSPRIRFWAPDCRVWSCSVAKN